MQDELERSRRRQAFERDGRNPVSAPERSVRAEVLRGVSDRSAACPTHDLEVAQTDARLERDVQGRLGLARLELEHVVLASISGVR